MWPAALYRPAPPSTLLPLCALRSARRRRFPDDMAAGALTFKAASRTECGSPWGCFGLYALVDLAVPSYCFLTWVVITDLHEGAARLVQQRPRASPVTRPPPAAPAAACPDGGGPVSLTAQAALPQG